MIDLVQSFSHLGHLITPESDDGEDITIRKHSSIGQVNNILCYFGKLSSFVKYYLFHAYCTIVIMDVSYGRYQIVTLQSFVLLGGRACGEFGVFRFRLTVFCYTTFVSMPSRLRRNMSTSS